MNWEELAPLFEKASSLPPEEQRSFLVHIKKQDTELWNELRSLLASAEKAQPFLEDAMPTAMPSSPTSASQPRYDDPYGFVGSRVGRYLVHSLLGRGGMGVVYKAEDTALKRFIALKFLPPSYNQRLDANERFLNEARAASALDHPNVCTIHEIGKTPQGQVFIAMAFYEGETLKERIERGLVPLDDAIAYTQQIASGLQAAHRHQIIHRDIKPGNVIITESGTAKLLDFGVAKIEDQHLTRTGTTIGTVGYMSPEQFRGSGVAPAVDIWSLGVIMYELTYGERPFTGAVPEAVMYSVMNEEPAFSGQREHIPAYWTAIIQRCLHKDPDERYGSMTALLDDLKQEMPAQPAAIANTRSTTRSTTKIALAAIAAVVLIAMGWAFAHMQSSPINANASAMDEHRIVVLPFEARPENNDENQAFADGLMYVLTNMLTQFDSQEYPLWVIPNSEVERYGIRSSEEAAEMVGATMVLQGTMERLRDVIGLTLNLVDPQNVRLLGADMSLISSEQIHSVLDLSFQEELIERLAGLLGVPADASLKESLRIAQPRDPDAYAFYLQGVGYLQRYDKEGYIGYAIQQFEQSLAEDSLYAPAHAGLCEATWESYRRSANTAMAATALMHCQMAERLANGQAAVLISLASVYLRTGEAERAESALRTALEAEPDNAEAYRWLGRVYEQRSMPDSVIANYNKALVLKPNNWTYYNELGIFESTQGHFEEALPHFEQLSRLTPDNHLAKNAVGVVLGQLNRNEEAAAYFEESLKLRPNAIEPLRNRGLLHYKGLEFGKAREAFEQAASEGDLMSRVYLGHTYQWLDETQRADSAWVRAIEQARSELIQSPGNLVALALLADAYAARGMVPQSLETLNQIPDNQRDNVWVAYLAGRVLERANMRQEALAYLKRALERHFDVYVVDRDPWLEDLRQDPAYIALRTRFLR